MFHFCIFKSNTNATLNLFLSQKCCGGQRSTVSFMYEFFGAFASDVGTKGRGDISSTFTQVKYILCCRKHRKVIYVTYSEYNLKMDSHKCIFFFLLLFMPTRIIFHHSSVYFLILFRVTLYFFYFN